MMASLHGWLVGQLAGDGATNQIDIPVQFMVADAECCDHLTAQRELMGQWISKPME